MRAAPSRKNPPDLFPTLHPRATLMPLPLPDGSRTLRARREEGPLKPAVTCGWHWGEAGTSLAPLADLADREDGTVQPATGTTSQSAAARCTCIIFKGGGAGWTADRACGEVLPRPACRAAGCSHPDVTQKAMGRSSVPETTRKASAVLPCRGGCPGQPGKPRVRRKPVKRRSEAATACRMPTSSGETRARARFAPPCACASHAHPNHSQRR